MNRKLIILFLVCFTWCSFTFNFSTYISKALEVTPDTMIEREDVVKLNYTLWILGTPDDPVEAINGTLWVHDPNDPQAPNDLYEQFQDLTVPPCVGFLEGILGMKAGEERTFNVYWNDGKAFNNVTDPWYQMNLKYNAHVHEILHDATELPFSPFDIPGFTPLMIFLLFLVIIIVYYRIKRYSQSHILFSKKKRCISCNSIATVKCGNPSCNTPYCKDCFIKNNHCKICSSNRMIPFS